MAGGALVVVACFLAFGTVGPIPIKVKDMPGAAGKIMWVFGLIIVGVGLLNKRWFHVASLIAGVLVLLLAFNWQSDIRKLEATVGIGSWLMLAGAALAVVGSIIGLLPKKQLA